MEKITIHTEYIKLNQAVKLASIVSSGSDIKELLLEGIVTVNGNTVSERGKKLYTGDTVNIYGFGGFIVESENEC